MRVGYAGREVLHGLTFDVRRGETVVVIGGSGSGKSTMLRTLVGLEKLSSGQVQINGVDISTASARQASGTGRCGSIGSPEATASR